MNKEFIPYTLALTAKNNKFNEPCFSFYYKEDKDLAIVPKESGDDIKYQGDDKFDRHQNSSLSEDEECSAPLYQQLVVWFREKHNIEIYIVPFSTSGPSQVAYEYNVRNFEKEIRIKVQATYSQKEAYDKAFEEAFKLIKT